MVPNLVLHTDEVTGSRPVSPTNDLDNGLWQLAGSILCFQQMLGSLDRLFGHNSFE